SLTRSSSRARSAAVSSSRRSVLVLRSRYSPIPAASSNRARRSSAFSERSASIILASITTAASAPRPVPRSKSWMSRSRTGDRFRRYSLWPERDSRRVTRTSWYAIGSVPSVLLTTRETSATFTGRRPVEPWKITSSILPPRNRRGDCSPSTQRTASEMFDLPQPLGPTMAVTPASNGSSTVPANDLKPDSSSRLSLMPGGSSGFGLGLIDPVRAAELAADPFGDLARRVRPQHDAIPFVGRRGRQDFGRQPGAPQLLREALRPVLVLRHRHLHVQRPFRSHRVAGDGDGKRLGRIAGAAARQPAGHRPQVGGAAGDAATVSERVGCDGHDVRSLPGEQRAVGGHDRKVELPRGRE